MEKLKRVRKAKGMSLSEVAELSGLHREAIARAERADTDVRASTLSALSLALGVPVCELFDVSGHERKRRRQAPKR